jgi:hypothetical protein
MSRRFLPLMITFLAAACGPVVFGQQNEEQAIYTFQGPPNDGAEPNGGLIADTGGNLYGATLIGGTACSVQRFPVLINSPHSPQNLAIPRPSLGQHVERHVAGQRARTTIVHEVSYGRMAKTVPSLSLPPTLLVP